MELFVRNHLLSYGSTFGSTLNFKTGKNVVRLKFRRNITIQSIIFFLNFRYENLLQSTNFLLLHHKMYEWKGLFLIFCPQILSNFFSSTLQNLRHKLPTYLNDQYINKYIFQFPSGLISYFLRSPKIMYHHVYVAHIKDKIISRLIWYLDEFLRQHM